MDKKQPPAQPSQNPETELAQEIFARDRGAQRDVPLQDFLGQVERETRGKVRDGWRDRSKP